MTTKTTLNETSVPEAARLLRRGGLVAFPTETVYGLGANALDRWAVAKIFRRKHRPTSSPLIVHVASIFQAKSLVTAWPPAAETLATHFWPGPLTLVLPKKSWIPALVTAGLPTIAIRIPSHPVALALIREAGVPIAAPSANLFMSLSPTDAGQIDLGDGLLILDGGPSEVGIESTVLSLAGKPRLLRPGTISQARIEALIGPVEVVSDAGSESPGQHLRHYSPATPLLLTAGELPPGRGAYLSLGDPRPCARPIQMPHNPRAYAASLYRILHELDALHLDWIAVEPPPSGVEWAGITDRLQRATGQAAVT